MNATVQIPDDLAKRLGPAAMICHVARWKVSPSKSTRRATARSRNYAVCSASRRSTSLTAS